jgi:hypothetical protein
MTSQNMLLNEVPYALTSTIHCVEFRRAATSPLYKTKHINELITCLQNNTVKISGMYLSLIYLLFEINLYSFIKTRLISVNVMTPAV